MKFLKSCWCSCECGQREEITTEIIVIRIIQVCFCDKCLKVPGFIVVPRHTINKPLTFDDILHILQNKKVGKPCDSVRQETVDQIGEYVFEVKWQKSI